MVRKRQSDLIDSVRKLFNFHIRSVIKYRDPLWRGIRIRKTPMDLLLYAEMMWECQPNWVVECGTRYGGSALFFADMLRLTGGTGRVITVDILKQWTQEHDLVTYITGSSIDPETVRNVTEQITSDRVMVVLDSDHQYKHVKKELIAYAPLVTVGQYMVVEDAYNPARDGWWEPKKAIDRFLQTNDQFTRETKYDDKYLMNYSTMYGWLRRVK